MPDRVKLEIADLEVYLAGLPIELRNGSYGAAYAERLAMLEIVRLAATDQRPPDVAMAEAFKALCDEAAALGLTMDEGVDER